MTDTEPKPLDLPMVYGVWIEGSGWLRDTHGRIFSDMRREYAYDARMMYRGPCFVILIDESMIALEPLFLEREKLARDEYEDRVTEFNRITERNKLINRLKRWANVILRHRN